MKEGGVQVGVIGLGDHSNRAHLMYLVEEPDCTITAIADIDEERVESANAEYGLKAQGYQDWQELVDYAVVDAILIMTPDRFHTPQTVGAIAAGKHVFCEKPLASDSKELGSIRAAFADAESKGLIISTCHPRRFDPPFLRTKEYLEDRSRLVRDFKASGDLGEVTGFTFNFDYHKPSKQGLHHSLMFDHLNHEIDAMHFLFGYDEVTDLDKHYDGETEFKVTGKRLDGIDFSFTGARHREESIYPEDMLIRFEHGNLTVDLHEGKATLQVDSKAYTLEDSVFKTNYLERFAAINRHFIASVMGLEQPYIAAEEVLTNTRVAIELHDQPASSKYIH